jgi:hypothetical protein
MTGLRKQEEQVDAVLSFQIWPSCINDPRGLHRRSGRRERKCPHALKNDKVCVTPMDVYARYGGRSGLYKAREPKRHPRVRRGRRGCVRLRLVGQRDACSGALEPEIGGRYVQASARSSGDAALWGGRATPTRPSTSAPTPMDRGGRDLSVRMRIRTSFTPSPNSSTLT